MSWTVSSAAEAAWAPRSMPEERIHAYRERAAELVRPYRSDAVQDTISRELLPALLGGQTP